jgi:hypothetical protein
MVPSLAIPKAILKISIVEGLKCIPKKPMIPAVIKRGIRHGIFDKTIIPIDLNKARPISKISTIAIIKLTNKCLNK